MNRAINAGRASIELGIKSRIDAGLKAAKRKLSNFGSSAQQMGTKLTGIGVGLAAPFTLAATRFASFDDAMRAAKATANASPAEFAALTEEAKRLGRTTSFTAVEVANLMTTLGRAGFDPAQINNMTESVLNLARATGTDAEQAAGFLAAGLNQFNLDASEAARVADVLTATANNSFVSLEQLGESMKFAGPVAADLGMSIEETAAILGTLGNVGIQGSIAGTALRRLGTISAAEADKMEGIFGVAFKDADGNARPLIEALGDVGRATENLPTAERAAKFNEAFGLLGITGASAISKNAVNAQELLAKIDDLEGTAAATAEEMDKGLGGSFRKVLSAAEGVAIAVGESLAPALQWLSDQVIAGLGYFTAFVEQNRWLILTAAAGVGTVLALGAGLITLGIAVKLAAVAVGVFITGLGIIAGAFALLFNPITWIIGGIAALGIALLKYTTLGVDAVNWLKNAFAPLVNTFMSAFEIIKGAIQQGDMATAWAELTGLMEWAWIGLTGVVQDSWGTMLLWLFEATDGLVMGIGGAFQALGKTIQSMLDSYKAYYDDVFNYVADGLTELGGTRVIGGRSGGSSPFEDHLGGLGDMIDSAGAKISSFGDNLAEGNGEAIEGQKLLMEQRRKEREERLAEFSREQGERKKKVEDGFKADADAKKEETDLAVEGVEEQNAALMEAAASAGAMAGPSATFDAFAASIIGLGPRKEDATLAAAKETAKNTKTIAEEAKKPNEAKFGE